MRIDPAPGGGAPSPPTVITQFVGVAQKGPFIRVLSVFVSELDAALAQTGRTFITEISDNTGRFDVRVEGLTGPYAKLDRERLLLRRGARQGI